jgi:hypothetical protein
MNPFIFGGIVEGEDFVDREEEMEELEMSLSQGKNVILLSPRKYGKTSLVINTLNKMRQKGMLCAYINLIKVTSFHRLMSLYLKAITQEAEHDRERAVGLIKSLLPKAHQEVNIDLADLIDLRIKNVEENGFREAVQEVFDFPQKVALKKNKKVVVAFNEFQEIEKFDGGSTLKPFKSCVKKNHKVSYFFSRTNLDNVSALDNLREEYNIDKVIELKKIPRIKLASCLAEKFEQTGFRLEQGVLDKVLQEVSDCPYNAQFLCHELWEKKQEEKEIRKRDVDTTLHKIVKRHYPFYMSLWDNLTSRQRNVLRAVARFGGEQIFSKKFAGNDGVGSMSSLQTSVQLLQKKNILTKLEKEYEFTDVFFKEWIKVEIE